MATKPSTGKLSHPVRLGYSYPAKKGGRKMRNMAAVRAEKRKNRRISERLCKDGY